MKQLLLSMVEMSIFPKFGNIVVRIGAVTKQSKLSMVENVDISQVRKYCGQAWCQSQDKVVLI